MTTPSTPRTEMKYRRCDGFSSTQICWHCSNLPDAITYAKVEQLRIELTAARSAQERAEAELTAVREALKELVRLKGIREQADAIFTPDVNEEADLRWRVLMDEYERCKPLAWEAARKLIGVQHE